MNEGLGRTGRTSAMLQRAITAHRGGSRVVWLSPRRLARDYDFRLAQHLMGEPFRTFGPPQYGLQSLAPGAGSIVFRLIETRARDMRGFDRGALFLDHAITDRLPNESVWFMLRDWLLEARVCGFSLETDRR